MAHRCDIMTPESQQWILRESLLSLSRRLLPDVSSGRKHCAQEHVERIWQVSNKVLKRIDQEIVYRICMYEALERGR